MAIFVVFLRDDDAQPVLIDQFVYVSYLLAVSRLLAEPMEGAPRGGERGEGEHEPLPGGDGTERRTEAAKARPRPTGGLQGRSVISQITHNLKGLH